MQKKTDIRIVKTKRSINKAFLELLQEIGFSKITVSKIIERAEINRSTFYSHYLDKFDLLCDVENSLLSGIKDIVETAPFETIVANGFNTEVATYIEKLVLYMYENSIVFALLIGEKGDPAFVTKLSIIIKTLWDEKNVADRLSVPQSYVLAAMTGIMSSLIIELVSNNFRESPEEFAAIAMKIVGNIPKSIFNSENLTS